MTEINRIPRATDTQFAAIIERAKQRAELLRQMAGIVDPVWLESTARRVVAQALGEKPEHTPNRRLFTTGNRPNERDVAAYTDVYTEADRDLFDAVWRELQHELDDDIADTTDDTNV